MLAETTKSTVQSIIDTMIENGKIENSPINQATQNKSWLLDGVIYAGKEIIKFIGNSGATLEPIFVIVAIGGFFIVMAGYHKLGNKVVGGSILGYMLCKVCDAIVD